MENRALVIEPELTVCLLPGKNLGALTNGLKTEQSYKILCLLKITTSAISISPSVTIVVKALI